MPPRRAVELRVGGQTYRVVATDDDGHVQHLADLVDRKFVEVVPQGHGRSMTPQQAMFMTALALAQELEEERARAARFEAERDHAVTLTARAKETVGRLLSRVDGVLASMPSAAGDGDGKQVPAATAPSPDGDGEGEARAARAKTRAGPSRTTLTASDLGLTDPRPPDLETAGPLLDAPDVRPSLPNEVRPSLSNDVRPSLPREVRPSLPRGGLRLVRQSGSSDDDSR